MNKYLTGAIIAIVLFISGVLVGRYYFSQADIKVDKVVYYPTKWTVEVPKEYTPENFEKLLFCYESPIKFSDKTEDNYLFITAKDECKEATAKYQIVTKGNYKIYIGVGIVGAGVGGYLAYKYLKK